MTQLKRIEQFSDEWSTEELEALLDDYDYLYDEWSFDESMSYELGILVEKRKDLQRLIERRYQEITDNEARDYVDCLVVAGWIGDIS